ncbi:hypothetical protein NPS29_06790 [Pseudomonas putida]|uniref:hypothetical protein n=1 Tax=Pseudomonas putida TaxID=303 RepID=UPI00236368EC|nr:hypothetical protein [Pseudomonas putida]MDD1965020.1 hypothetical protein [Pseudomonas putida]
MISTRATFAAFILTAMACQTFAADITQCPKVSDITAKPHIFADMPEPFNEGFQYEASTASGKWLGFSADSNDDYLQKQYGLTLQSADDVKSKIVCNYEGKDAQLRMAITQ